MRCCSSSPISPVPSWPSSTQLALSLGMDVLTEVKSESELAVALEAGADIIGVNQREKPKSQAFTMDYQRAERMAPLLPDHVVTVAESGIAVAGGTTMAEVRDAGYDAALIGEALVTSGNPADEAPRAAGLIRRPTPRPASPPQCPAALECRVDRWLRCLPRLCRHR